MGNTASVINVNSCSENFDNLDFPQIERLCKYNVFMNEDPGIRSQYKDIIEYSIINNHLDYLEVLIPAGRIKDVYPLHLSAKHACLESLELLVSAGFNPELHDKLKRNPLHYSSMNKSIESSLCAHFLVLKSSKLMYDRDADNNTPAHTSVEHNNIEVLRVILNSSYRLTTPGKSGLTCRQMAVDKGYNHIVGMIDNLSKAKSQAKSQAKQDPFKLNQTQNKQNHHAVDTERIMLVWERFFENAFKSIVDENSQYSGLEIDMAGVYQVADRMNVKTTSNIDGYMMKDQKSSRLSSLQIQFAIQQWLGHALCYFSDATIGYLVYNLHTGIFCSLDEYLRTQKSNKLYKEAPMNKDAAAAFKPITTLADVVENGWMAFYDDSENRSYWMHISSGHCESYLRIPDNDLYFNDTTLLSVNRHPDDSSWIFPTQNLTYLWALAPLHQGKDNKSYKDNKREASHFLEANNQNFYYINKATGHTTWHEPEGWESVVEYNLGWVLILDTETDCYFWWSPTSGESVWYE